MACLSQSIVRSNKAYFDYSFGRLLFYRRIYWRLSSYIPPTKSWTDFHFPVYIQCPFGRLQYPNNPPQGGNMKTLLFFALALTTFSLTTLPTPAEAGLSRVPPPPLRHLYQSESGDSTCIGFFEELPNNYSHGILIGKDCDSLKRISVSRIEVFEDPKGDDFQQGWITLETKEVIYFEQRRSDSEIIFLKFQSKIFQRNSTGGFRSNED